MACRPQGCPKNGMLQILDKATRVLSDTLHKTVGVVDTTSELADMDCVICGETYCDNPKCHKILYNVLPHSEN